MSDSLAVIVTIVGCVVLTALIVGGAFWLTAWMERRQRAAAEAAGLLWLGADRWRRDALLPDGERVRDVWLHARRETRTWGTPAVQYAAGGVLDGTGVTVFTVQYGSGRNTWYYDVVALDLPGPLQWLRLDRRATLGGLMRRTLHLDRNDIALDSPWVADWSVRADDPLYAAALLTPGVGQALSGAEEMGGPVVHPGRGPEFAAVQWADEYIVDGPRLFAVSFRRMRRVARNLYADVPAITAALQGIVGRIDPWMWQRYAPLPA